MHTMRFKLGKYDATWLQVKAVNYNNIFIICCTVLHRLAEKPVSNRHNRHGDSLPARGGAT